MKDLVGRLIAGKYEVTQRIGGGGVADVYEAIHQRLNQHVAIKVLRKEFARFPAITRRFLTEGRAASAVKHPGIVQVFDVDQLDTGELYIVMELLQGEELSVALERDQQFEPDRAVNIALQLLEALEAAHGAGVVHRDLKPENVLLLLDAAGNEQVKIIDFGVARLEREGPAALRKTQEGTIVGTPYYISPEQARGEPNLDHRTDIYAVGVLLYEMLTGELPYTGTSVQAIIKKVLEDPFPSIRAINPSVSEALDAAILQATSRNRDARQASAAEFARQLRAAVGRAPVPEPLPTVTAAQSLDEAPVGEPSAEPQPAAEAACPPPRKPVPPPRRAPSQQTAEGLDVPRVQTVVVLPPRLWLIVLGGAVVAAGIVAVLFLYTFRRSEPSETSPAAIVAAAEDAGLAAPPADAADAVPPSPADAAVAPPSPEVAAATISVKELDAAEFAPPVPDASAGPTATVRLLRLPRGATVTLDDEAVGSEFTAPIADAERRLRIEASGWKTWSRTIRITADVEMVVDMERRGSTTTPADAGGPATTDTFRPLANPFGTATTTP